MSATLETLIETFDRAKAAWDGTDPDCFCDGPEWQAYQKAEAAIVRYPCADINDVRTKARFFLNNEGAYDTIRNCFDHTEETLLPFLRSLIGDAS